MKKLLSKRGMTLIEVVTSAVILSMITVCLLTLMLYFLRGWNSGTASDTAARLASVAVQKLSNEIRDGRQASASAGALVVTFPKVVTDATTGERIYDLSANDPITRSYYISDGKLMRNISGATSIIGEGITSATFGAAGGTVTLTVTATSQEGTKTVTKVVTSRVALRNFRS